MILADPLDLAVEMREHAARLLAVAAQLEDANRARRMERIAESLLRSREPRAEICRILVARFSVTRRHAYRVIERALQGIAP